ncbi:cobyrinate a,c-diamide synthase [Herbaspirillum lusitanum]|uniref:Cobyrinate a,c-diamide synthase n=1 Tax=Herbaspirillum lusitanum TaxID=213312 RepID=A0ABW9ADY2_9BURK
MSSPALPSLAASSAEPSGARRCPALFISAPGSGHGKTTVTAAIARLHREQGRRVRVFKTGPDFLDPTVLERASGHPVYQLDLWLAGAAHCRALVQQAAQEADLILIEGVMGLYDGAPCSADLAALLGMPVLLVINAAGVAQSMGALAHGLASYRARPGLSFAGVLANGVGSERHAQMLQQGMDSAHMPLLACIPRQAQFSLPERHLGLVPAAEVADLDLRLSALAAQLQETPLAQLPEVLSFDAMPPPADAGRLLAGRSIAIARDAAFSFIYQANLDWLQAQGAHLRFFSPLSDAAVPDADAVYLPGGYPELHLQALQDNRAMQAALRAHFEAGKHIYAECGGMLYLLNSLTDKHGQTAEMCGLLPGTAEMQTRLQGLGYQSFSLPEAGQEALRCHTFHYSRSSIALTPAATGQRLFDTSAGEAVYRLRGLCASYLHAYFASAPRTAAQLFGGVLPS